MVDTDMLQGVAEKAPQEQAQFLCSVATMLTVQTRVACAERDFDNVEGINELLHKILGQIGALLVNDTERYPDDVLLSLLQDMAQERNCGDDLSTAWALACGPDA